MKGFLVFIFYSIQFYCYSDPILEVFHFPDVNIEYKDTIAWKYSCSQLEELSFDLDKKHGKTSTWLTTINDTIQFNYQFEYNRSQSTDENYTLNIVLKMHRRNLIEGEKIDFKDSIVFIFASYSSVGTRYSYKSLGGEFKILKRKKRTVRIDLNLYAMYYENSIRCIIDNEIVVFRCSNKKPLKPIITDLSPFW